ncbi:MAG TPA: HAMP domain-containing protein [Verrucomicrobiae bacterium]
MVGIALGMAAVLASGLFWQIYHGWRADELAELEQNGRLVADQILSRGAPMLRSGDLAGLQGLLAEMAEAIVAVNAIQVRTSRERVLVEVGPKNPQAREHRVTVPITQGDGGRICVLMDTAQVSAELAWLVRRLLLTITAMAGLGTAGAWWVARLFTRPIRELVEKTRAVKAGDLRAWAPVRGRDEIGELAAAFNEMMAELREQEKNERQLLRKLINAEDEERKRVARELHDHTGQALTSLIAGLAALKSGGKTPQQVGDLLNVATQALEEVHDLSRTLRPLALDELGLDAALKKLCDTCSQQLNLAVKCQTTGFGAESRLPHSLEVALYRIGQEALTNAVRHGHARSVDLLVHRKPGSVLAVIEDDGDGFDVKDWRARCLRGDHVGLLSMEQRATLLGGSLRIESRPGGGISLFVEIPVKSM